MSTRDVRSRRAVTLNDVAHAANVSRSTASEALSGNGRMTSATRQAVVEAATRLGYRPNALAQGLRTGRTRSIGLHHQHAADRLESAYFRGFVAGALDVAQECDYDLTLLASNPGQPRRTAPRVDGVIIADPIVDDLRAQELITSPMPMVAGEHIPEGMASCPVVAVDHEAAVRSILDDVFARGVRAPVFIGPDAHSGWGLVLKRIFVSWCEERGVESVTLQTSFGNRSVAEHEVLVRGILATRPDVDFILGSSAAITTGAANAVRAAGRRPGVDVLLAACADTEELALHAPPITAIVLPARALGAACARLLVTMLEDADYTAPELTILPAEVAYRESTAPLR